MSGMSTAGRVRAVDARAAGATLKLAVAVADRGAPPSAFVVFRGVEAAIAKAAELGYHGVELALKAATEVNRARLARQLDRAGLAVSAISTGQVAAVLGLSCTHPEAGARRRLLEVLAGLVDLAAEFGGVVSLGRARGCIPAGGTRGRTERLFVDTARRVCDLAAARGVTVLIEPINRYETNFVNTLDEGAALMARVGRVNLGLMPDVFHMNIEESHVGASLARHGRRIRYIHLADSNRLAPGQGHLDFDDVFDGLRAASFRGWAAIEILPRPDPCTAARQAAAAILPRLRRYNRSVRP